MSVPPTTIASEGGIVLHDAEKDLLRRLQAGEPAAFDELVADNRQRIARLVYRLLGWCGEVEDLVQDVLLVAYRKVGRFRGQSSLSTWLIGIAINRCRSYRRRWMPSWRWLERLWRRRPPAPGPDRALMEDETAARVRKAVQELGESDREAIVLYYLEDLPAARIGQLLGISAGAVDMRLHRARRRLREKLADLGKE